ncbi:MAG: type transporter [Verrucomicrobiales bacterium]|nr:type transporter [Verrucomicrobiales bacterium]
MSATPTNAAIPEWAGEERVIRARHGLAAIDLRELWHYRELLGMLTWRNISIRYKQTYLGIAWAVLQPVLTVTVLTLVFQRMTKIDVDTQGVPYPLFVLAGLLPWQFFANALGDSSGSLLGAQSMITKIYFPRILIPISAVLSGCVDFVISLVLLFVMMIYYHMPFTTNLLLIPVFFLMVVTTTCAMGFWFSALNVKYRDVKYIVPFIIRIGMFVCPVMILGPGPKWQFLYSALNPLVGILEGFRWSAFGHNHEPFWPGVWIGLGLTCVLLVSGAYYFRSTEKTFADII